MHMKPALSSFAPLALLLLLASPLSAAPVRLILDTDMSGDGDDAGALALLHLMIEPPQR